MSWDERRTKKGSYRRNLDRGLDCRELDLTSRGNCGMNELCGAQSQVRQAATGGNSDGSPAISLDYRHDNSLSKSSASKSITVALLMHVENKR
jgi:hypothetical protein